MLVGIKRSITSNLQFNASLLQSLVFSKFALPRQTKFMYADFRLSSTYPNGGGSISLSDQHAEKKGGKVDIQRSTTPSLSLESDQETIMTEGFSESGDDIASEVSSANPPGSENKTSFLGQEMQQVEHSSRTYALLKAGYRNSNRAAVALGVTGGLAGGILHGPGGAAFGMSLGSSVGSHLGAVGGVLMECSKPSPKEEVNDPEEGTHDVTAHARFFGHTVQLVDQAGHHAAVGSIGVGVGVLATSLVTGSSFLSAIHIAGVYSGVTWAFGLTTGSAHWLLEHLERSKETLQREQTSYPGDIELSPLRPFKSEEEVKDDDIKVKHEEVTNN